LFGIKSTNIHNLASSGPPGDSIDGEVGVTDLAQFGNAMPQMTSSAQMTYKTPRWSSRNPALSGRVGGQRGGNIPNG
jgi:hypothetical protein